MRVLPAVWLLLLLIAPVGAWLLGVRQPLLQNQPKAPFPALNRSSIRDRMTFARLDAAVLDRLPLRGTALKVHARAAVDVFHDSTNPDVALGDNGWLYFVPEVAPCQPGGAPIADPADAVELLARTFVAGGYRPIVVTAGSKLFIHVRDAPSIDPTAERCARSLERHVEQRLARTPGGLTIDARLRRLEAHGKPTFLHSDTHWNWRGREVFVRAVLDRIRPGLADEAGIRVTDAYQRDQDLADLLGLHVTEQDRHVAATRTPRRPLAAGSVVLVGDSQVENSLLIQPGPSAPSIHDVVLPGQPTCDWATLVGGGCDAALRAAHTVLIEKVERDAQFLTEECWRPLAIAAERLAVGRPGRWVQVDGERRRPSRSLTIPASGTASVRVLAPTGDVSRSARLLRLPIVHAAASTPVTMTQAPQGGSAAPCATQSPLAPEGALFLPVPAGRRVSDLVVVLSAAPGTRFGAPEETILDGRDATRARG